MLLNTLVNPGRVAINRRAEAAHSVTAPMLRGAPSLADLWPQIRGILSGNRVVIYNAKFDRQFFPDNLACAGLVECAMQAFVAAR
jgi:DNA polymerase III epsilon subunit-like protein